MVFNPFAPAAPAQPEPKKSHWERLDPAYRELCQKIAGKFRSPQNRRVREAADMSIAKTRMNKVR